MLLLFRLWQVHTVSKEKVGFDVKHTWVHTPGVPLMHCINVGTFNALSVRFIVYKPEAVMLTFQVAEYVSHGGCSIEKESLFLHSSLTNLAET